MNLLQWFNQHAVSFTLILAYIPLIATVVTTIVSLVLVRATLRYSEASDRSRGSSARSASVSIGPCNASVASGSSVNARSVVSHPFTGA